MTSAEPTLRRFLLELPKTETHLHFEGALPLELLARVNPKYKTPPDSWAPDFKFRDFAHFQSELSGYVDAWFTSPERCHEAARRIFKRHLDLNVRYVETSFASGLIEKLGLNGREILDSILTAVPDGLVVRVFMGIHHDGAGGRMARVFQEALTWKGLAGFDLHGTESNPLEPWTASLWREAREGGKCLKAHAGEFMGPDFIRRILRELQPNRIEHGVRAIEDPSLMEELKRHGITLDMCPISNHKLMPGVSLENHPIRGLFDAGVNVTVSTDDPIVFGNNVVDDYQSLAERRGFGLEELAEIARNGFRAALISGTIRDKCLSEIDRIAMKK